MAMKKIAKKVFYFFFKYPPYLAVFHGFMQGISIGGIRTSFYPTQILKVGTKNSFGIIDIGNTH